MDTCTGMIINYSNTPAELLETEQPLRVDRYAFVPDSGGAGHYRGSLAMERHLRVLADEAILQIRSDRRDVLPYGLEGGSSGAPSSVSILRADGEEREYPAKFLTNVTKDDVLKVRLAGGGLRRSAVATAGSGAGRRHPRRGLTRGSGPRLRGRGSGDPASDRRRRDAPAAQGGSDLS